MTISEPVQIQMIIVFGSIITAIVGVVGAVLLAMVNRTRQHARVAAVQTQNSHKSNLRDDLDGKFEGLDGKFEGLANLVKGLAADLGGMKAEIRGIRQDATNDRKNANDAIATERDRIRHLEDTLTPAQLRKMHHNPKEKP